MPPTSTCCRDGFHYSVFVFDAFVLAQFRPLLQTLCTVQTLVLHLIVSASKPVCLEIGITKNKYRSVLLHTA